MRDTRHDCIKLELQKRLNHDEISTFLDAYYVSASEAGWRLFEFPMHYQSHTVIHLAFHLPDQQNVCSIDGHEGKQTSASSSTTWSPNYDH